MSTMNQPEVLVTVTAAASTEVKKFMEQENVDPAKGGLRVSVQPGGCSGFKYGLLIEDAPAEDDLIVEQSEWNVFVDPFSAQYLNGLLSIMSRRCRAPVSRSRIRIPRGLRLRQLVLGVTPRTAPRARQARLRQFRAKARSAEARNHHEV